MLMHQSGSASVRVVGTALVIAAASLFAGVASATNVIEVSTVVKYRDLDPSLAGDARRLYGRLKYAAQKVCNSYDSLGLDLQRREAACYNKALSEELRR